MKRILVLSVVVLLTGCGTSTVQDTAVDETPDPYADPPGYTSDPFAGFGPVTSIRLPANGGAEIIEEPVDAAGTWSVQVAACGTMEAAMTMRDTVVNQTGEPVFVDHVGNYYKVRVGSFSSSSDSDTLRIQLRSEGYPDAWSVQR